MKKALFATTALVLTAGVAAADVTISGYGRTGLLYQEEGVRGDNSNDTVVQSRLRMNVDASTSSDQGVDFGGRIRIQWDQGDQETTVAPGYVYITASGLRVEIGNANTAYDSVALIYASELGVYDRSFGNSRGEFFAYNTDGYPTFNNIIDDEEVTGRRNDYLAVFAKYTLGELNMYASVVDPDQVSDIATDDTEKEYGLAVDYTYNAFELAAALLQNGEGIDDNDQYFLGARYSVNDMARVGLNYLDNGENRDDEDLGDTFTLYGDYTMGLINVEAYIANNDFDENETDQAYGIGVNYDLGGARMSGSLQRGYNELVTADMGVRFDF